MEWKDNNTAKALRYWNEMYDVAVKYAKEHGSISKVPPFYVTDDGKKLGQWIAVQRGIRKGVRKHSIELNEERIAKLDAIGIVWIPPMGIKHFNGAQ